MLAFELYHGEISTCSRKVRITLAEKGLAWIDVHEQADGPALVKTPIPTPITAPGDVA